MGVEFAYHLCPIIHPVTSNCTMLTTTVPPRISFAAAVATAAAALPSVTSAQGERVGSKYFIRYSLPNGPAIELDGQLTAAAAIESFSLFAAEQLACQTALSAPCPTVPLDNRDLLPLNARAKAALPLSSFQRAACDVFVLEGIDEDWQDAGNTFLLQRAGFALCEPVGGNEWETLSPGSCLIYITLLPDPESGRPTLSSHIGWLRVADEVRGLLYTQTWEANELRENSHTRAEITELWLLEDVMPFASDARANA